MRSVDRLRTCGDAELVRLVRLGQEAAFEELYERHHRGILSFCRHMLGSREEGEDAVQHTFVAAFNDLRRTDKPIHLKAWLYTIARNRCLSMLRARREQVALDDVEPATEGLAVEVERRQDLRDMLHDLRRLPDEQRAALVLAELGALSHEEIAMTLDVRKDKVKALVFQARESLSSARRARDVDCSEIQEQLSVLRGGSLRRATLRRHLEDCPACLAFREEVRRQRAAMAVLLPVVPTAGLKGGAIAGAIGGASAAGAGGVAAGGLLGGAAAGGGATTGLGAKILVGVALMGAGTGGVVAVDDRQRRGPASAEAVERPAEGSSRDVVADLRGYAQQAGKKRAADLRAARTPARPSKRRGGDGAAKKQDKRGGREPRGAVGPRADGGAGAGTRPRVVRRTVGGRKAGKGGAAGMGFGAAGGGGTAGASPAPPASEPVPVADEPQEEPVREEQDGDRGHKGKGKGKSKGPGLGDKHKQGQWDKHDGKHGERDDDDGHHGKGKGHDRWGRDDDDHDDGGDDHKRWPRRPKVQLPAVDRPPTPGRHEKGHRPAPVELPEADDDHDDDERFGRWKRHDDDTDD